MAIVDILFKVTMSQVSKKVEYGELHYYTERKSVLRKMRGV